MSPSEIDIIFASKSNPTPIPSTSNDKKKKKKKKVAQDASSVDSTQSKKRPAPTTIVDPSLPKPKRPKTTTRTDDEHRFKDSRGSTSRRKTTEGWSIYKEHELGIADSGGDTPLCPFDCECCF